MELTCGVALCTYNGQQYLEEQLESILSQERRPDAIVVCDDCSTDRTWAILQEFESRSPIPVKLLRNATQRGVVRNFEIAVSQLDTDLIFLCDQDDIWFPDKVAVLSKVFDAFPRTNLVFTDAVLVDGGGRELGFSLFGSLQLNRWEDRSFEHGNAFDVLCRRNVVTGATAAFRRSLLSAALPFPEECWHDEWLALIAAATGEVVKLSRPTIKYRQHGNNLVGVTKSGRLEVLKKLWWSTRKPGSRKFAEDRLRYRSALATRLMALSNASETVVDRCKASLSFTRFRAALPRHFFLRWPAVLWKALKGQYRQFGYWWKSDIFRDLIHK